MKKILLVEDDVFILEIYSRELQSAGYEIIIAQDGEEGISRALGQDFDLILLDIMMPKKTGLQVLSALRSADSTRKDTPVYLLTNLGQGSVIEEAIKLGIQGYLLKARLLPNEVVSAIDQFFKDGPMKVNIHELGLE